MTTTQGTPVPRSTLKELQRKLSASQEETKEALAQQAATNEVLRVIGRSGANLQPVFDFVVESADRLCAADYAFVYLPEGDSFRSVASFGGSPELVEINRQERRFRGRGTLVGRVALEGTIVQIPDVLEDTEYTLHAAQHAGGFRTLLGAPMKRADGSLVGIIGMARNDVRPFSFREIQLLETFADQAAIAIENARLFNETREALERQTALGEILRVISQSPNDVQPVLDAIAESAARFCAAEDVSIGLMEGEIYRHEAHHGPVQINLPAATGKLGPTFVAGRSMIERRTIHVPDLQAEADQYPDGAAVSPTTRAIVATPLLSAGGPIGAMFLRRTEVTPFTERQIELAETFAAQAVIAIENVRLFNETKEALERQTATAEILRAISGSPTDVQPVLDAIAANAVRYCGAEDAALYLLHEGRTTAWAHVGPFPDQGSVEAMRQSPSDRPLMLRRDRVMGRAVLDRATIHLPDIQDPSAIAEFPNGLNRASGFPFRAAVVTPLMRKREAIGVIMLRRQAPGPFSAAQITLVETFADQAVIAIENVRLFNETREALERQTATSELLATMSESAFDLKPVFEMVLDKSLALCHAEYGWIREFTDDPETIRTIAARMSETMAPIDLIPAGWATRASVLGRVYRERRTLHVADITTDPTVAESAGLIANGAHTALGVPLLRGDQRLGSIIIVRTEVRPFEPREIELVESFARQAAIAIENVRLFHEIQDTSRQLEIANRHKSEFLANMSHELRTPLNAIIGFSDVLIGGMAGHLDEKQTEYLEDIRGSGRHLLSLINDILDLSKVEAGRMELTVSEFSLRAALSNAVTMIRERAAGHGIGLDLVVEGVDVISADERKVKQILFNLLSNAVKFTPDGGSISVRAVRQDSETLVSVRDTGVGIPKQDQGRVFEEFRQSGAASTRSAETEGTGLGLALTKSFVDLHGGRIWVESEVGKGSTFHFTLPLAPPASPRASAAL